MKRGFIKHMNIMMFGFYGNKVLVRTTPGTDLPRSRNYLAQTIGWFIARIGLRIMLGGNKRWQTISEEAIGEEGDKQRK